MMLGQYTMLMSNFIANNVFQIINMIKNGYYVYFITVDKLNMRLPTVSWFIVQIATQLFYGIIDPYLHVDIFLENLCNQMNI